MTFSNLQTKIAMHQRILMKILAKCSPYFLPHFGKKIKKIIVAIQDPSKVQYTRQHIPYNNMSHSSFPILFFCENGVESVSVYIIFIEFNGVLLCYIIVLHVWMLDVRMCVCMYHI